MTSIQNNKTTIKQLLTSREESPLLKAALKAMTDPIKLHRHRPSSWWLAQKNFKKRIWKEHKKVVENQSLPTSEKS